MAAPRRSVVSLICAASSTGLVGKGSSGAGRRSRGDWLGEGPGSEADEGLGEGEDEIAIRAVAAPRRHATPAARANAINSGASREVRMGSARRDYQAFGDESAERPSFPERLCRMLGAQ